MFSFRFRRNSENKNQRKHRDFEENRGYEKGKQEIK